MSGSCCRQQRDADGHEEDHLLENSPHEVLGEFHDHILISECHFQVHLSEAGLPVSSCVLCIACPNTSGHSFYQTPLSNQAQHEVDMSCQVTAQRVLLCPAGQEEHLGRQDKLVRIAQHG